MFTSTHKTFEYFKKWKQSRIHIEMPDFLHKIVAFICGTGFLFGVLFTIAEIALYFTGKGFRWGVLGFFLPFALYLCVFGLYEYHKGAYRFKDDIKNISEDDLRYLISLFQEHLFYPESAYDSLILSYYKDKEKMHDMIYDFLEKAFIKYEENNNIKEDKNLVAEFKNPLLIEEKNKKQAEEKFRFME